MENNVVLSNLDFEEADKFIAAVIPQPNPMSRRAVALAIKHGREIGRNDVFRELGGFRDALKQLGGSLDRLITQSSDNLR